MERLTKINPNLKKAMLPYLVMYTILDVLLEEGCPESSLYLPLSSNGLTLDSFQSLLNVLRSEKVTAITIKNHWVSRGKDYLIAKERMNTFVNRAIEKTENN
jgi:hypothetical protein